MRSIELNHSRVTHYNLLVVSFLDLPELAFLVQAFPGLAALAADPILHKYRLRVIAPSRIQHALFGANPQGLALRPTFGDLIHRGVVRGLAIERRWRMGAYFYSRNVGPLPIPVTAIAHTVDTSRSPCMRTG